MENFRLLGLPDLLLQSLDAMEFHTPTPIQAQTIPSALQGRDILGSANTGTGKTAAYGIPLVSYLLNNFPDGSALVLTPTRELAAQVLKALQPLWGRKSGLRSVLLIGGDSMTKQLNQLRNCNARPQLIVGTPGRVNDHLSRGTLKLDSVGFFVLDETDRMLDMGFADQIKKIAQRLPEKHQVLMFSATMAPGIVKMASTYLKDAVRVAVGSITAPVEKIKQEIIRLTEDQKYDKLVEYLGKSEGAFLIFVKTRFGAERLADRLSEDGHDAGAIYGDLRQNKRERILHSFKTGKCRILVATDIAARGLDISHLEWVINFDMPQCPEDYIHRIGRTGRAGREGIAISFVTSQDNLKWKNICRLLNNEEMDDSSQDRSFRSGPRQRMQGARGMGGGAGRRGGFRSSGEGRSRFGGEGRSRSNSGGGEGRSRFNGGEGRSRFNGGEGRTRSNEEGHSHSHSSESRPSRFNNGGEERPRFNSGEGRSRFGNEGGEGRFRSNSGSGEGRSRFNNSGSGEGRSRFNNSGEGRSRSTGSGEGRSRSTGEGFARSNDGSRGGFGGDRSRFSNNKRRSNKW